MKLISPDAASRRSLSWRANRSKVVTPFAINNSSEKLEKVDNTITISSLSLGVGVAVAVGAGLYHQHVTLCDWLHRGLLAPSKLPGSATSKCTCRHWF